MLNKFDHYISRQMLTTLGLITLSLIVIIWLSRSLKFIDYIVNRGVSLSTFGWLTTLLLPNLLYVILPIALFTAIMFVYNRLQQDSELVIARASGLSPARVARPALMVAAALTLVGYLLSLHLIPYSYRAFRDLQFDIQHNFSVTLLEEGVFNELSETVTVYVRERLPSGELAGIMVHDTTTPAKPVTIIAKQGALVNTEDGPRVVVVKGHRQEKDMESGRLNLLYFDRYTIDLTQAQEISDTRWLKPKERYLPQLLFPSDSRNDQRYREELIARGHGRLITPMYNISFALAALLPLLYGRFSRHGQTSSILYGVALVIVWQAAALAAQSLAVKNNWFILVMYGVWFFPTAVFAYKLKTDRFPFFQGPLRRLIHQAAERVSTKGER